MARWRFSGQIWLRHFCRFICGIWFDVWDDPRYRSFAEKKSFFIRVTTVQFRLTIFLLVYWSLLINFGPSVHTHSYFGLHCGCGDAHVVEGSSGCGHSGCCPSEHADVPADSEVSSLHDCSLCKFFKYLNYSAADSVQWSSDESVHLVAISYDRFLSSKTFSSRARGPPALS